ncbi:MAG: di-trans,poly-cis-decaprenylcistransferase, partial [Candidatus Pacebacteria bacterium]|nr:di-trans,poly-cis-decaprenylcistransferase [Candidatus Paceibacterota bacterium]
GKFNLLGYQPQTITLVSISTMTNPETAGLSVGIIMDGNRRWARERGLHTFEGHKAGLEKIPELMEWAKEMGVKEVVLYAFSTENWGRAVDEVDYLMKLFEKFFEKWMETAVEKGTKIRFIGDLSRASEKIRVLIKRVEETTFEGTEGTLIVAFSYGGRPEILAAVNTLLSQGKTMVDEQMFTDALWSHDLMDPDIIVRTGGEKRLSNFLTWRSAYSELFFTDTKWPAFSKEEFLSIIEEYGNRERRRGK